MQPKASFLPFTQRGIYNPLLGWIIVILFISGCTSTEESIQPEIKSITESVYASVAIQPAEAYQVHSAVTGIIDRIYHEEGDTIRKGDPVLQIINTNPELNLENAKLSLDMAQKAYSGGSNVLKELEDEIEIAQLKLTNDSINFVKQRNLWEKNIGTQNTYETRELAYNTSKSKLAILLNRYQRTKDDLRIQLEQAENNYKNALNKKEEHLILGLIDGRIYSLLKEPGEMVSPQEPLAIIGKTNDFIIEMSVDEVDIAKLELDQTVIVALDAYPDQSFEAKVSKIYPQKNTATQTFTVEAVFDKQPTKLFSGLSGEANIVISTKTNALVIPRTYLTTEGEVQTDEGLIKVETGLMDLQMVEILSGIGADTNIYLPKK